MTDHRLAETVRQVLAYRGWHTPEKLDQSYRPERAPVGGATIRRIINQQWQRDDDELVLLRLAGMLRLPPRTLILVRAGDTAGLERLVFTPGDEAVQQLILDIVNAQPRRSRKRNTG